MNSLLVGLEIEAKEIVMTTKRWMIAAGGVLAAGLVVWMWMGRSPNEDDAGGRAGVNTGLAAHADAGANAGVPLAAVAAVERHNVGSTLTIAGEFKPFQDVDVHAKGAGYIRKIYADGGDRAA